MDALTYKTLERKRILALAGFIVTSILVAALFVLIFVSPFYTLLLFPAMIFLFLSQFWKQKFATAYKYAFVVKTLNEVFEDVRFMPENGLDEDIIAGTHMMRMGTSYTSNDYMSARYHGVCFEQADVLIRTRSGKHTVTLFRGRWMIFEFNKKFCCDLQVRETGFPNATRGSWFSDMGVMPALQTENVAFNEQFKVFADNQPEAFYILTPHFMERIMELRAKADGELLLCFTNNRLHIACNTDKDAFEPSVLGHVDAEFAATEAYSDVRIITQIIDELNLNTSLYKGE